MEKFYLEEPSLKRKKEALDYLNEFVSYNSEIYGTGSMDNCLTKWTYEEFLTETEKRKDKNYAYSINKCPAKTFFFIRESDNKIIGMINIRFNINKDLIEKGATHIGYSIRPTERQKGYNKIQLYLGLKEEQKMGEEKVLIGCTTDNIGSNKSIVALGGVLEKNEIDDYDNMLSNYYWINVKKSINDNFDIFKDKIIG